MTTLKIFFVTTHCSSNLLSCLGQSAASLRTVSFNVTQTSTLVVTAAIHSPHCRKSQICLSLAVCCVWNAIISPAVEGLIVLCSDGFDFTHARARCASVACLPEEQQKAQWLDIPGSI